MPSDQTSEAPRNKRIGLAELLASWEPLPAEEALAEIDNPPPEPMTCFDDYVDEDTAAAI